MVLIFLYTLWVYLKNHSKSIGFYVLNGIEFDVKLGVGVKICRVKFKPKKSKILRRNLRRKMLIKKMDFRQKLPKNITSESGIYLALSLIVFEI